MFARPIQRAPHLLHKQFPRPQRAIPFQRQCQPSTTRKIPSQPLRFQSTQSSRIAGPNRYAAPLKRSRQELFREALRQHPYQGGLAVFVIFFSVGMAMYANYIYVTYFHRVFHNFPDSVAKPMKRALFYTNYMLEPKKALKNYKEAIFAAQEANMDPYSPEVLGMKIQVAAFMEKVHNYEQAILVLEDVRRHCLMWVEEKGAQHVTDGHRTRILGMTVGLAVKLGELYSMEWVGRQEEAEEVLVAATETVLKEKKRREAEGVKEGEGEWLDDEQIGGSVEALAQLYSSKGNHTLAAPLYLQALSLCPPKSCHAVILMNNIATSIAEKSPSASAPPNFPSPPEQAALWAQKAIDVSETVPESERTDECSTGCATAKANLAELAERAGRFDEALRLFGEAEQISKDVAFAEGVNFASLGRKRVQETTKNRNR